MMSPRLKLILLVQLIVLTLPACQLETFTPACIPKQDTVYTAGVGVHNFEPKDCLALITADHMDFQAKFDSNVLYKESELAVSGNQVNKLYGFSDCSEDHMVDSARVGWIVVNGELLIVPFVHVQHQEIFDIKNPLATIKPGQWYTYHIQIRGDKYEFSIDTDQGTFKQTTSRGCSGGSFIRYRLSPYFGGQSTTPHPMSLEVKLL